MLQITEIYYSIQGESSYQGKPCVFIRLTGCDLRCSWCDTEYAFHGGEKISIEKILEEIKRFNCKLVEITGGEPLLQRDVLKLAQTLINNNYTVLLETGGHRSIKNIPQQVVTIMDIKCPGSGEETKNNLENIKYLKPHDEIKFVITDKNDFLWAKSFIQTKLKNKKNLIHFSPVYEKLKPEELSQWILSSQLSVKMTTQLHKQLGLP
ncbi:MAG TPA: radical SAM protein [Bdellovibrionota bacterium]|nr:radical SAM protein [Bdellovibrionota bacterium]